MNTLKRIIPIQNEKNLRQSLRVERLMGLKKYEGRKFYYDCTVCGKRHEVFLNWPVKTMGRILPKKIWQRLKFESMADLYIQHQKLHPIDIFPYHEVKMKKVKD